MRPTTLTPNEIELLNTIVQRRIPTLARVTQAIGFLGLSEDQREEIRLALADELCEAGLAGDGEPNRYGSALDDIIGKLANY